MSTSCKLCGYVYCKDHLLPQRHNCVMLQNVEYVKTDLFSNVGNSAQSNESAKMSVNTLSVTDSSVEKVNVPIVPVSDDVPYWLYDCLNDAKNMIMEYHDAKPDDKNFVNCAEFFAKKTFGVKVQNNGNASGDVNLIRDLPSQPSYKICIHDLFQEDTRDNRRMVTVILIHHLLHALHPSRMHDSENGQKGINRLEHEIANRASYHDAVLNLESLYQSGKLHMCKI